MEKKILPISPYNIKLLLTARGIKQVQVSIVGMAGRYSTQQKRIRKTVERNSYLSRTTLLLHPRKFRKVGHIIQDTYYVFY